MARTYRGWKPTAADLDVFRDTFEFAYNVLSRARTAISEELGYTKRQVDEALPVIGDVSVGDDLESLRAGFQNRDEFKREISYLKRISESESAKVGTRYKPMTYEAQGALTAGRVDATGRIVTQFMERERQLARRRANDRALRLAREAGIEMERVPVLDAEGNQVRDQWRHKVFTYVPKTPANERELRNLEEKNPAAQYIPPEAASGQYVMKFGDLTRLGEVRERKMGSRRVYESLHGDRHDDIINRLYFANYQNVVQNTLAGDLGDEISGYIDKIQRLDYPRRYQIYKMIEKSGAEYAQLDFYYHDIMSPTNIKLARMVDFWRHKVAPKVDDMLGQQHEPLADVEPVTPNDPSYIHLKGGPAMAAAGGIPTVFDVYHVNAKPTGHYRRGNDGKLTNREATGITMDVIEDMFFGLGGL